MQCHAIDCFVRRHGYVSNTSCQLFPLLVILSCCRWGRVRCFCLGIYEGSCINQKWEGHNFFGQKFLKYPDPPPPPQLKTYLPLFIYCLSFIQINFLKISLICKIKEKMIQISLHTYDKYRFCRREKRYGTYLITGWMMYYK